MKKQLSIVGLCLMGLLSAIGAKAQSPTAAFSLSSNTVCVGDVVNITDMSTDGPTSWSYTLDAANVSTAQNPSFTYTAAGVYTIALVASNSGGDSPEFTQVLVVNALPSLSVSASAASVCAGETVSLNGSGASTYSWSSGIANNVAFTPTVSDTYTLTAQDINGCLNAIVQSVVVNPLPVLSVSGATSVCLGSSISQSVSGASSYNWSSGSTSGSETLTPSVSGLLAVAVTGTDAMGCENVLNYSISVNALPTVTAISGAVCEGDAFVISPSGAASYVYSSGSSTVSPSTTTNYSITGTDANGCSSSAVVTVSVVSLPVITANGGAVCAGSSFTITPSGASTYSINGGSFIVSPASTNSYSISGTSADGCTSSADAVVNVTVNPVPVITVNNATICAGNSFTLNAAGALTYTYSSVSNIVTPTSTTSYSVTGTSSDGCVSSAPAIATVSVNPLPALTVNSGSICSGSSFTVAPSGAQSYSINGGLFIVSPLASTSYTVSGTDANSCSASAVANVTVYASPVLSVNSGSVCAGSGYTISPSGASTYTITGGNFVVTPLSNTSYTVSGTSVNGCQAATNAVADVTVNAIPVITVNSGSICSGQSFTMASGGASTYTYTGGSAIVSPGVTTSYSVSGTSPSGCISSAPAVATVVVNATPTLAVSSGSVCAGNQFTISPSGAVNYSITGGQFVVSPTSTTSYTITGDNANSCTGTIVAAVSVGTLPVITAANGTICAGNNFVITPAGASSYTISGGTFTVSPAAATSYTINGSSAAGCFNAAPAIITVNVNNQPTVSISASSASICANSSVNLTASGASSYTWSSGNYTSSTVTFYQSSGTVYTVTGSNGVGCNGTATVAIAVFALPQVNITPSLTTVCSGGNVTLSINGANTYSWSNGSTGNSIVISPTATTSYSAVGTDTNNCASSALSVILTNSLPLISATASSASVCPGDALTLSAGGASSYTWSTNQTGSAISVTPVANAVYTVSGTDAVNACVGQTTVSVSTLPLPSISISASSASICAGNTATLIASGATTYTWASISQLGYLAFVSPLVTSAYSVSGTGTNGCTGTQSLSVYAFQLPNVGIAVSAQSICAGEEAVLNASGASSYTWMPGNLTGNVYSVTPTVQGQYTLQYMVTGEDINGCTATSTVALYVNSCTGISEHSLSNTGVNVFPNPSKGQINLQFSNVGYREIRVLNSTGELIMSKKSEETEEKLDLSGNKAGVYFILVTGQEGSTSIKSILE